MIGDGRRQVGEGEHSVAPRLQLVLRVPRQCDQRPNAACLHHFHLRTTTKLRMENSKEEKPDRETKNERKLRDGRGGGGGNRREDLNSKRRKKSKVERGRGEKECIGEDTVFEVLKVQVEEKCGEREEMIRTMMRIRIKCKTPEDCRRLKKEKTSEDFRRRKKKQRRKLRKELKGRKHLCLRCDGSRQVRDAESGEALAVDVIGEEGLDHRRQDPFLDQRLLNVHVRREVRDGARGFAFRVQVVGERQRHQRGEAALLQEAHVEVHVLHQVRDLRRGGTRPSCVWGERFERLARSLAGDGDGGTRMRKA